MAGISQRAFAAWLVASALILVHAVATNDLPFVALGAAQTGATGFITAYVAVNAGHYCPSHAPARPATSDILLGARDDDEANG